ncbi:MULTISPECIES: type VI secretion system contractile sheath large subunit [Vibrio harveyi group]|uniref:type VI secretion system contractile sheath large subunit n=1 Tax=Vibrio harveyi group TaxID=717610 RepID=UPI00289411FA|nr:Type VI secretion system contractile sheath large subunit [Vibrio owensii]HDM8207548.1 type VI secretion system contractile sheath large subunit [Vibrio campbellii]HDM8234047.1 type VI secretion system contractile sheath large subunit [Vibrio campbellii]
MANDMTLNFLDPSELKHEFSPLGCAELDSHWVTQFVESVDSIHSAKIWLEGTKSSTVDDFRYSVLMAIDQIDQILEEQLNEIIHHQVFQALEKSWLGVRYLCEQTASQSSEPVKIKVLSATWDEVSKDALKAIEFDQSALFKLLYQNEYGMPGGEPFGVVIGDYELRHDPAKNHFDRDLTVLSKVAQTAAAAFSPFILSAQPSVFGVNRFSELSSTTDIGAQFEQVEYIKWQKLRESEDAKFIGIAAPNVLFRLPYTRDGSRIEGFDFEEAINDSERELQWGSAAFCFAAIAIRTYQEHGWFTHMRGVKQGDYTQGTILAPTRSSVHFTSKNTRDRSPLNLKVSERKEKEISDCGFITMSPVAETYMVGMTSSVSIYKPRQFEEQHITMNAKLTSMLQYTLCVSRIAHYIKVMGRDKIGGYQDADSIQRDFQKWLHQYTTASDEASDELRAKYPLNEANISVKEKRDSPGHYYSVVHLRPHFQLDQMVSAVKLITELSPEQVV